MPVTVEGEHRDCSVFAWIDADVIHFFGSLFSLAVQVLQQRYAWSTGSIGLLKLPLIPHIVQALLASSAWILSPSPTCTHTTGISRLHHLQIAIISPPVSSARRSRSPDTGTAVFLPCLASFLPKSGYESRPFPSRRRDTWDGLWFQSWFSSPLLPNLVGNSCAAQGAAFPSKIISTASQSHC